MHLLSIKPAQINSVSVPMWMYGAFRRNCISFADGTSDTDTRVFWLQSRQLTIDLRLPTLNDQRQDTPDAQADYEGWYAHSCWQDQLLSWHSGCALQLHNRWPEPAQLQRTGNCMMEFAPSGVYTEDWRLLNGEPGPLIGLELINETDLHSNTTIERHGALIICGDYAGLVCGRKNPAVENVDYGTLKQQLLDPGIDEAKRADLLDFETSIALGNIDDGYRVTHSLHYSRMGQLLLPLDGFTITDQADVIRQRLVVNQREVERCYRVDTWIPEYNFSLTTAINDQARQWLAHERGTLTRYTRVLK